MPIYARALHGWLGREVHAVLAADYDNGLPRAFESSSGSLLAIQTNVFASSAESAPVRVEYVYHP